MKFNDYPVDKIAVLAIGAALLSACGGNDSASASNAASGVTPNAASNTSANIATGTTNFSMSLAPAGSQAASATPAYHLAAVLLDEPASTDVTDPNASARLTAHYQALSRSLESVPTRGLTVPVLRALREEAQKASAAPMTASGVITYSPAQIRAAYGLPTLPASGTTLSAAQAAQLGAGQTIYLLDANSDPNVTAELAAFDAKFGLPNCTVQTIATNSSLPLATASTGGCSFSVVNVSSQGTMTSQAPAYDSGWATEIALDVQWAHATAPMARIILINTPDASTNSFTAGVALANAMGPGIVSMSFGAQEGNWTSSASTVFSGSGMTYLASAGDSGSAVNWPAVAPNVLAVGGTSLSYSGSGSRSESAWSDTGGGISQFTAVPSYQTNAVPGIGTLTHRSVSDVAFNANPNTGQYLAVMEPGSDSVSWASAGGTSISSPQWAGIIAIADALRAQASKSALGDPHAELYQQIGAVPGTYASAFYDVTTGSDGNCTTCSARVGYDQVTGLGTPNVASLLSVLVGSSTAGGSSAPVVSAATITGQTGTALTFQVSASSADTLTYTLANAPSGMTIASNGTVSWPKPVAGTYMVTVTAKDSKTGLSGSAVYTIIVSAPTAPIVSPATIDGTAGVPLTYTVTVSDNNTVSFTLSGAPSGMSINSSGVLSWSKPVAGTYRITVTAKDSKTGLSGQGTFTVAISATSSSGPQIIATPMSGLAGMPIAGMIVVTDAGASAVNVAINNAPLGMSFIPNGPIITILWPVAVAGNYTINVTATDSNGHSAQLAVPVSVAAWQL